MHILFAVTVDDVLSYDDDKAAVGMGYEFNDGVDTYTCVLYSHTRSVALGHTRKSPKYP